MHSDYIIRNNKIVSYTGDGGDIIIPDGVTELDELCFTKIVIRKEYDDNGHIKEYKACDFDTKKRIKSIYIPNSVKTINEDTFSDLVNLEKVTFQSGSQIKEIPRLAFIGCKSLNSITLPESVEYVDSYAFANCDGIQVTVGSKCKVNSLVFGSNEYLANGAKLIYPDSYEFTKHDYSNDSDKSSSKQFLNIFMGFCFLMIFVYLVLFVIVGFVIDSVELTRFIIILGIINLILLFVSFCLH